MGDVGQASFARRSRISADMEVLGTFAEVKLFGDRLVRDVCIRHPGGAPPSRKDKGSSKSRRSRRRRRVVNRFMTDDELEAELAERKRLREKEKAKYVKRLDGKKLNALENELALLKKELGSIGDLTGSKLSGLPAPPADAPPKESYKHRRARELKGKPKKKVEKGAATLLDCLIEAGNNPQARLKKKGSIVVVDEATKEELTADETKKDSVAEDLKGVPKVDGKKTAVPHEVEKAELPAASAQNSASAVEEGSTTQPTNPEESEKPMEAERTTTEVITEQEGGECPSTKATDGEVTDSVEQSPEQGHPAEENSHARTTCEETMQKSDQEQVLGKDYTECRQKLDEGAGTADATKLQEDPGSNKMNETTDLENINSNTGEEAVKHNDEAGEDITFVVEGLIKSVIENASMQFNEVVTKKLDSKLGMRRNYDSSVSGDGYEAEEDRDSSTRENFPGEPESPSMLRGIASDISEEIIVEELSPRCMNTEEPDGVCVHPVQITSSRSTPRVLLQASTEEISLPGPGSEQPSKPVNVPAQQATSGLSAVLDNSTKKGSKKKTGKPRKGRRRRF